MPNWCECDLTISGKRNDLLIFKEWAKNDRSELSANQFLPYPEQFTERDEIAK